MLRDLQIENILLISSLELHFQPGLNVLTGETGAGKSILLDSLGLALGWRGRADIVRAGASQGSVTAIFDPPKGGAVSDILAGADLPQEDELILRRVVGADGRKRAFVNDRRVSGETLRALSDALLELHGQHDDRGLLNPSGHRALLDAFGGHETALGNVRTAWREWQAAKGALADFTESYEAAARDAEYLEAAVEELDALAPEPGEEAKLDGERRLMLAAERIREDIEKGLAATGGDGAVGAASTAIRWLEGVAPEAEGRLDDALGALSRGLNELAEAERAIEVVLTALGSDPATLEATEERLFAIRALARKHRVTAEELPGFAETLRARRAAIAAGDDHRASLAAAVEQAEARYAKAAAALGKLRATAAKALDAGMAAELPPLKMERAVFTTNVAAAEGGPDGTDAVSFEVATNVGAPPGPIARIASGGELSRFLLALKVCLSGGGNQTLIFDEIDRGVGGATADAVGRRLAQLAETGQVLVVTHSPQVAARAAHHWQVRKGDRDGMTETVVSPLDRAARIDEIARMLAGETITEAARSAAEELLAG